MVSGGDMVEITWSNPNLGSGQFFGLCGEDSTYTPAGYQNTSNVDGGRRLIVSKQWMPGSITVVISNDMGTAQDEYETVQLIKNELDVHVCPYKRGGTFRHRHNR